MLLRLCEVRNHLRNGNCRMIKLSLMIKVKIQIRGYKLILIVCLLIGILGRYTCSEALSHNNVSSEFITCNQKYGKPAFIPLANAREKRPSYEKRPPVLMSLPGSGNSWVRLLIEYSTGIFTGSLEIKDMEYRYIFRGENHCGLRMSVIKVCLIDSISFQLQLEYYLLIYGIC